MNVPDSHVLMRLSALDSFIWKNSSAGNVVCMRAAAPKWMKLMVRAAHGDGPPDQYVMEIVNLLAGRCRTMVDGHLCHDTDPDDVMTDVVADASAEYAHDNNAIVSDQRRWLMWKDGKAHWPILDDVLANDRDKSRITCFDDLMYEAMVTQFYAVASLINEWVTEQNEQAEEEQQAVQEALAEDDQRSPSMET